MSTVTEDQTTQNQATECQCREQIADILKRLETLERDALTVEKTANLKPSTLIDSVTNRQ